MSWRFEKLLTPEVRATLGHFSASGTSKKAAQQAVEALIAAEPWHEPVVMLDAQAGIWTFYRLPGCWAYRMPSGSVCMLTSARTEAEARNLFEQHFLQVGRDMSRG